MNGGKGIEAVSEEGDINAIVRQIGNVFDPVVSRMHPEIEQIKDICNACGALASQMTGSGSVVFAIMPDITSALRAEEELKKAWSQVFLAEPV